MEPLLVPCPQCTRLWPLAQPVVCCGYRLTLGPTGPVLQAQRYWAAEQARPPGG